MLEDRSEHQDSPGVLHTGDLVLLKCQVAVDDLYAEDGLGDNDTGWVYGDGIRAGLSFVQVDRIEGTGLDIREFLFMVVGQLNYASQKDLKKRLSHIEDRGLLHGSALHSLRLLEERAKQEEEENIASYTTKMKPSPLYYGDVIQLLHVRTRRFVSLKGKLPGKLNPSARRVELQPGSSKSWLRLTPLYTHKVPGHPVMLAEQTFLTFPKLQWNLSWTRAETASQAHAYEVNCAERGRGFYCMLYNRNVLIKSASPEKPDMPSLSFGLAISLSLPHSCGLVAASCSPAKRQPLLKVVQRGLPGGREEIVGETSGKCIWVIEHVATSTPLPGSDNGITYLHTPLHLRHYGSGRYLSVNIEELKAKGMLGKSDASRAGVALDGGPFLSEKSNASRAGVALDGGGAEFGGSVDGIADPRFDCRADLVDFPGPGCVFVLEPCEIGMSDPSARHLVPLDDETPFLLRWDNPFGSLSYFLSCNGVKRGKRDSYRELVWSEIKLPRDAITLKVISDTPWMLECDVISEHAATLRRHITPRCPEFDNPKLAAEVCARMELMLTDMIYYLSGSPLWRSDELQEVNAPDVILFEAERVVPHRQQLIRELKYIDATVDLFNELVKVTPNLARGRFTWKERALMNSTKSLDQSLADYGDYEERVGLLKTHCLKVLIRVWIFCFLHSEENARYFSKNGWVATIDSMNGHGLGASDAFVALLHDNAHLVRNMDKSMVLKFINFIRMLGPLDTWLHFLHAVCAPNNKALFSNQQAILGALVFPGERAPRKERVATERNRRDLLISLRLYRPTEDSIGPPSKNARVVSKGHECLGSAVLSRGLHEIVISWTAPDDWRIGEGVLYHKASVLGLRLLRMDDDEGEPDQYSSDEEAPPRKEWASLASLVWVLQPETCCPAVHGISWEEMQQDPDMVAGDCPASPSGKSSSPRKSSRRSARVRTRKQSVFVSPGARRSVGTPVFRFGGVSEPKFDVIHLLAKYLLAQLSLVADLATQRQSNCIMALQEEYSFELCVSGAADQRLPFSIRSAFLHLLVDLWVDRYPHHQVVVPSLLRDPNDFTGEDLERLPAFQLFREEEPDSWSRQHRSRLPNEVVRFYELGQPHKMEAVLRLMRQHFYAGPIVEQQVYMESGATKLMNAMLRLMLMLLRFGFVYSLPLLQELQGPVLRCLDGRIDIDAPHQISAAEPDNMLTDEPGLQRQESIVSGCNSDEVPLHVAESVVTVWQSAGQSDLENKKFTRRFWPILDNSEQRYAASDHGIVNAKIQMLQVICHMMNAGMHVQITRFMNKCSSVLNANDDEKVVQRMPGVVQDVVKTLDDPVINLKAYGLNEPNVMLIDMLMYNDPVIFTLALQVLCDHCMRTAKLTDALRNVIFLTPAQHELFHTLQAQVATLGQLLNSFENWAVDDYYSDLDHDKFQQFQRICLKIRNLCDLGDASSSPAEVQRMLAETQMVEHIDKVIQYDLRDFTPSCQDLLGKLVALVCSMAARFVADNTPVQNLIHKKLSYIINLMGTHADACVLLTAVFQNNYTLCDHLTTSLVSEVGRLIVSERAKGNWVPWYLSFYATVTSVPETTLRRNQVMIVELLQKLTPEATLHLLQDPDEQDVLMELIKNFRSYSHLQNPAVSGKISGDDAELIYYIRCVELLVALAVAPKHENSLCKAFVSDVFCRRTTVQLLSRVYHMRSHGGGNKSVEKYLSIRWFRLLHLTMYDVDSSLLDLPYLVSEEHRDFLMLLLQWLEKFLDLSARDGRMSLMEEQEEECLRQILTCVGSFFSNVYGSIREIDWDEKFDCVTKGYTNMFRPLMVGSDSFANCIRDTQILLVTAYRIVSATKDQQSYSDVVLRELSRPSKPNFPSIQAAQQYWNQARQMFLDDPRVQEKMEAEQREFGDVLFRIGELTDPERAEYVRDMPEKSKLNSGLPDNVDFRRSVLTMEQVLRRIIRFSTDHLTSDFESIRRVQTIIKAVLKLARSGPVKVLEECHEQFVRAGVTDLIIAMLDAKTPEDIDATAWTLLAEVLQGHPSEGFSVSTNVQEAILKTFTSSDDSGMWESFAEFLRHVTIKVKSVKVLKEMTNLTAHEIAVMKEYENSLQNAIRVMEAVRLTVEGHYFPMQQYLFAQVGNGRSCNVLEFTTNFLARLCKDHKSADMLLESEIDCMTAALALLIEAAQGPNTRNQEFLSTVGLIETIFNVLGSNFASRQKVHLDVYPAEVRKLKAQCMQTMQSLLEGRLDDRIHKVMLQRSDSFVMRERMCFLYLYYVFGSVGVATGRIESEMHAIMPLNDSKAALLDANADPSDVYAELCSSIDTAEELLEDLDEQELDDLFSEGLNVLVLVFQLASKSPEFEQAVMPVQEDKDPFQDDPRKYMSQREYQVEKVAFHRRAIYRLSFDFLARFVRTIEVVMNGQVQQLHFPRPLTEMWYVFGLAKEKIESSVPISSKEAKMKTFIRMCQKSHSESKLIRLLSRFSIMPESQIRWAQRHLWDSAHRPFQTFLKDDAAKIEQLLGLQLFLGLGLTFHTGFFLVPKSKDANGVDDGLTWSSPIAFAIAETMGALYFVVIALWLGLTCSVKLPLNYEGVQQQSPEYSCMRCFFAALIETLWDTSIASRFVLLLSSGAALFAHQFWLYGVTLADLFYQNSTLGDVCRCIFSKIHSLSVTFFGCVIVTYVYAALGYSFFRNEFGNYCDVDLHICVQNILYQGNRNGVVGLSILLKQAFNGDTKFSARVAYDSSYFVVIGVMFLNTIVAQIVDSFYELRGETEAREQMKTTQTFISCLDRQAIEDVAQQTGISNGFEYHETKRQNKWDYMAFIYHLREKDAGDYTGPEQRIRSQIELGDTTWLPIGRSLMLDEFGAQDSDQDMRERIETTALSLIEKAQAAAEHRTVQTLQMQALEMQVDERMTAMEAELAQLVANLSKARHAAKAKQRAEVYTQEPDPTESQARFADNSARSLI